VRDLTQHALLKGLECAVLTMGDREQRGSRDRLHRMLVAGAGTVAGTFGFVSVLVELPISTCMVLRSIADIARSEGHDLSLLEVRLSCLEVFALGSKSAHDDTVETGYWAVRAALAKSLADAAAYIAANGLKEEGAPVIALLLSRIAARFSSVVTEQLAAKAIPFVGAVTGGTINYLFMKYYQEVARGHFIVKRLEAKYGSAFIEEKYSACNA